MRIVAIGAHPDDVEFGCGGTLIRFIKSGWEVQLIVMTCSSGERCKEMDEAAVYAGWNVFHCEFVDTLVPCNQRSIKVIEEQLAKGADIVFTHYPEDSHQDHINTTRSTLAATRNSRNVLYYEGFTTLNFYPSVFVELDSVGLIHKMAALAKHASQVTKTNITGRHVLDMADANAISRGIMARTKHAEGFVPVRLVY